MRSDRTPLTFTLLLTFLGAYLSVSYNYIAPPIAEAAVITHTLSLQQRADQIAQSYGVSTTTLHNLIQSESEFNPLARNGNDRGIAQINSLYHPEVSDAQAYDPIFGLNFAAQVLATSSEDTEYVVCNCYLFVKAHVKNVPKMIDIVPNSSPTIGGIVIMQYGKLKHVAIIEKFVEGGFYVSESNLTHCLTDHRLIQWLDPHIVGYALY